MHGSTVARFTISKIILTQIYQLLLMYDDVSKTYFCGMYDWGNNYYFIHFWLRNYTILHLYQYEMFLLLQKYLLERKSTISNKSNKTINEKKSAISKIFRRWISTKVHYFGNLKFWKSALGKIGHVFNFESGAFSRLMFWNINRCDYCLISRCPKRVITKPDLNNIIQTQLIFYIYKKLLPGCLKMWCLHRIFSQQLKSSECSRLIRSGAQCRIYTKLSSSFDGVLCHFTVRFYRPQTQAFII